MIFLIGSIVFSSFLTIAFKICERMGINTSQAIVFNYLTCIITGCIINGAVPGYMETVKASWFPWALLMGLFFITFFNITAITVKHSGVAVASVANKLSLVIPFVFSIFLYGEPAGVVKIAGILLALAAVVLTCFPKAGNGLHATFSGRSLLLPGILFFGSGLLDTIIKYTEQRFISAPNRNSYLVSCFSVAFATGFLFFMISVARKKMQFDVRAVWAGICIGIPNYLSIWCLVTVLQQYKASSSAIIPLNNMGIVLLSAVAAWLFFRERLSYINWLGIFLALVSILMITSAI
jgi:drug/metabolite transporter (DMT)-like permease